MEEFIKSRFRAFSLYAGLIIVLIINHEVKSNNINTRESDYKLKVEHIHEYRRLLLLGGGKCADGWASGSEGSGTCSWHGGVDRSRQIRMAWARELASIDPEARFNKAEKHRKYLNLILVLVLFGISPGIDKFFGRDEYDAQLRLEKEKKARNKKARGPLATRVVSICILFVFLVASMLAPLIVFGLMMVVEYLFF